MQIKLVIAIATATFAGFAAAQKKCPAQNILDECMKNAQAVVDGCDQTDYQCLCQTNKAKLECYINCPQDPTKGTQESLVSSWCVSAGGDTSSSVVPSPTSTETTAPSGSGAPTEEDGDDEEETGTDTEETGTDDAETEETSTSTEANPSSTADNNSGAAGSVASPAIAFGVVAGFAAIAGALL